MEVERYYNDKDELAVLISPGYGSGWSTLEMAENLAIDKRVVEKFLSGATVLEMLECLEEIGYHDVYLGGYKDLKVVWIPRGEDFIICEYDGSEYIKLKNKIKWITA